MLKDKHIAILGGGPIGLEAALAAAEAGCSFTVYECSPHPAGRVHTWRHIRLFTPWSLSVSDRMKRHLRDAGQEVPCQESCPTGEDLLERVLAPVANLPSIRDRIHLGTRVLSVGRCGLLKHEEIGTAERSSRAFRLLVRTEDRERYDKADVVLDCTGTSLSNALGDGGIPAPGEMAIADSIVHDVPDFEREEGWAGRTVLLVGSGHSAQTAAREFVELASEHPQTRIVWIMRHRQEWSPSVEDPLPARASLLAAAASILRDPPSSFRIVYGAAIGSIDSTQRRLRVSLQHADGSREDISVDTILALTGRVGDRSLYGQLQIHECYATSGPMRLAAALMSGEGEGDCMQQSSQGADALRNPEPNFFILGSKSYGRRTDFLLRVGWQQVDEAFELLRSQ